jgi:hypothetical protein
VVDVSQDVREVEGQGLGEAVSPGVGAGSGASEDAPVKFEIWSWGSCKRSYVEMIWPHKLNFEWVTNRSGIAKTEWFVLDVINNDSRKNLNREFTFIDVFQPIIVYHHGAYSCSNQFETVYLVTKEKGSIVIKELPIEREVKTENVNKYSVICEISYVEYGGERIVLKKKELSKKKVAYVINIKVEKDKIVISGDTYEVRELLKKMRFKWDPDKKTWVAPATMGVDAVKAELEKVPEVILKEDE